MKPVDQTLLSSRGEPGDCFRACIASMLELPIEDVPHFAMETDRHNGIDVDERPYPYAKAIALYNYEHEAKIVNEFLAKHGKRLVVLQDWSQAKGHDYALASGPSATTLGLNHCVVINLPVKRVDDNGRIEADVAHDPNPIRAGILEIQSIEIIEDVVA